MDANGSGDHHHHQVQAAAGRAVGDGPPSSASATASSLPPPAPSASDAAVQTRARDALSDSSDSPDFPPPSTATRYAGENPSDDDDHSSFLDHLAPPSDGQTDIATGFHEMEIAMKDNVNNANNSGSGMDPPLPPSQMAALAEEMVEDDDEYGSKKKAAPTTKADDDTPSASLMVVPPISKEEETLQRAQDPPTPRVARAPSSPPADQGRRPSNPEGQQQICPPQQSMMSPPAEDADPPVSALPCYPSITPVVATLVEDRPEAIVVPDLPVYNAVQVAERTWIKKYKKYIFGGLGILIGTAVTAGVALQPSKSSSPSEAPSSSLRPSSLPSSPPSTYWSTLDWSRQSLGFNGDASDDWFGAAVAFSADASTMAVGAPGREYNNDRKGYVKIYHREGEESSWEQRGDTIHGEVNGDQFGRSLSLYEDGATLSIGAPRHDTVGPDSGQVKVYEWNETASNYVQIGDTLYGTASGDEFGWSLDILNSKILAVGAVDSDANGSESGQVTIYAWDDASSNFKQRGEAINGNAAVDHFGYSISLAENGQTLAVGAIGNDSNGSESGQVKVFEWDEATSNYEQLGTSLLGDAAGDYFGWSVSFSRDGTALAIGAIGADRNDGNGEFFGQVKVFLWEEATSNFEELSQSLYGKGAYDYFGVSVALSMDGKNLAAGATQGTSGPGYVEVYEWDEAASEYKRLGQSLSGEGYVDQFGHALAFAGNVRDLAVGAPTNDKNGTDSGRVEVFDIEL